MKTWTRATVLTICGGPRPNCVIEKGDPMLVLQTEGLRRTFVRCPRCAGEEAPPVLPDRPVLLPPPVTSMRRFGLLPLDEAPREPGCDDD